MDDLTQKTNEELFVLYKKERNPEIRRELTMRYLYIATSVARQMYDIYSSAMQMEDAVNEGVLAIMRGIDSYDPDKNVKFSTYISPRIRGVMLDYMRKQEWMPRGYRKQLSLIEDAMQTLETDLGRPPTKEEVAEHVGLSVKRCQRILSLRSMSLVQSLDVMMQDEKTTQGSQIPVSYTHLALRKAAAGGGIASSNAGVRVAGIVEDDRDFKRVYDPSHPDADGQGLSLIHIW